MEVVVNPSSSFWAKKRVLVTGHTGFKGVWLCLWLKRLGAEVNGLSLEPTTKPALWDVLKRPFEGAIGDIRDKATVNRAFKRAEPEIVLHLAAQALVHPSYDDPVGTFATNVMGLIHVLEAARETPTVRAIVNVTSDKCYENREQIWAYREDEAMGGSDPYSASKGCAELVTASYRKSFFSASHQARLASARAGNVIGGGDWSQDRLIADCVRAFEAGTPITLRNPLATRPWQHVLEPLSGYLCLAQALYERGADVAEGWNFGPSDEDAWTVARVVERVIALWGTEQRWVPDPSVRGKEALLLRVDATKARLRLGWRPRLNINEALGWTVEWYKTLAEGGAPVDLTLRQIERYENLAVEAI